jgi:hypothetical protein
MGAIRVKNGHKKIKHVKPVVEQDIVIDRHIVATVTVENCAAEELVDEDLSFAEKELINDSDEVLKNLSEDVDGKVLVDIVNEYIESDLDKIANNDIYDAIESVEAAAKVEKPVTKKAVEKKTNKKNQDNKKKK